MNYTDIFEFIESFFEPYENKMELFREIFRLRFPQSLVEIQLKEYIMLNDSQKRQIQNLQELISEYDGYIDNLHKELEKYKQIKVDVCDVETFTDKKYLDVSKILSEPIIIRGYVERNTNIISGKNFSVQCLSEGYFRITFDKEFPYIPCVVATSVVEQPRPDGDNEYIRTTDNVIIRKLDKKYFEILTGDANGNKCLRPFTFIAM